MLDGETRSIRSGVETGMVSGTVLYGVDIDLEAVVDVTAFAFVAVFDVCEPEFDASVPVYYVSCYTHSVQHPSTRALEHAFYNRKKRVIRVPSC